MVYEGEGLDVGLAKIPGQKAGFEKLSPEEAKELVEGSSLGTVENTTITKVDPEVPNRHQPQYTKKRVSKSKKKTRKRIAKASKRKNRKRK